MEAISIEILNPKALQLIKGMQALHLIKISKGRVSRPKATAKKKKPSTSTTKSSSSYGGYQSDGCGGGGRRSSGC